MKGHSFCGQGGQQIDIAFPVLLHILTSIRHTLCMDSLTVRLLQGRPIIPVIAAGLASCIGRADRGMHACTHGCSTSRTLIEQKRIPIPIVYPLVYLSRILHCMSGITDTPRLPPSAQHHPTLPFLPSAPIPQKRVHYLFFIPPSNSTS